MLPHGQGAQGHQRAQSGLEYYKHLDKNGLTFFQKMGFQAPLEQLRASSQMVESNPVRNGDNNSQIRVDAGKAAVPDQFRQQSLKLNLYPISYGKSKQQLRSTRRSKELTSSVPGHGQREADKVSRVDNLVDQLEQAVKVVSREDLNVDPRESLGGQTDPVETEAAQSKVQCGGMSAEFS